ncbi:hypothetical protein OS493_012981 [Desmophyllum pertusum]|uniref:SSD domain-containing protein n=1 Tax=Desmophyllum pertusum TaxID=174260 RepID=A0A9W9Z459_9CNID|nr:hypothetical protein OS493_012981 [Desmophyllum pertusum]
MNVTRAMLDFHLDKHAVIDSTSDMPVQSRYTRSLFYIGYPLKGFHNTEDRVDMQWDEAQLFASEAFATLLHKKFKRGIGAMKFYYFLRALFFNAISQQSLWITGWAVFSILTCFFGANLIYRVILDCRYIGIFHVLSVFIILGIGADDVFVFIDTWKASESKTFRDMAARMSFVYRRAASAMFTTSFTTMVAFVTSVFSPLLGVSTFGIFSALLVFVNYCSVIIFFPTVIITYEYYWKNYRWHCFGDLKAWQAITSRREDIIQGEVPEEQQQEEMFVEPSKRVSKFLENSFFENFIAHKRMRWIILGVFLVFLSVSIGFAIQLTPDEEPVDVWGPGTNWYNIKRLRRSAFRPSQEDNVVEVNIIWGLKNQDRSSCHFTDFKCKGRTVFDTSFDLNPAECQVALLDFCKELKNLPEQQIKDLRIRRNAVTGEPEIQCFMERLNDYLQDEANKPIYSNATVFTIPSHENDVRLLMARNPHLFQRNVSGRDVRQIL